MGVREMTKEEAHAVMHYVARNFIAPLCNDKTPARDVYLRLSGDDFNKFYAFMQDMIK